MEPLLVPLDQRCIFLDVSANRRPRSPASNPERSALGVALCAPFGKGRLRTRLRAEQSAGMGQNSFGRRVATARSGQSVKRGRSTALERLAHIHGIESSYVDATGQTRTVSPETLIALLEAYGITASTEGEVKDTLAHTQQARNQSVLEVVNVVWGRRSTKLELNCSALVSSRKMKCLLHLEDGTTRALRVFPRSTGRHQDVYISTLPYGYHTLEVQLDNSVVRSVLICAPPRAY